MSLEFDQMTYRFFDLFLCESYFVVDIFASVVGLGAFIRAFLPC